jgi:SAM-dependent methyltransferase
MVQRSGEGPRATSPYDSDFFENIAAGSLRSARVVVPMVLDLMGAPASIVDVGCGTGSWLRAFMECGIDDVLGVDGDYVSDEQLEIPIDHFRSMDLTQPIPLGRVFDLVLCLEVAEHLHASSADALVESLTALGSTVLFSAAIPYQGGREHVNEQWPEYWAEKFRTHGFSALDPFRARLWADDHVEPWFAQNLVLYVADDRVSREARLETERARTGGVLLSLVHPRVYVPKARSAERLASLANRRLVRTARRFLRR